MNEWFECAGLWLLVAGPLFQAAVELDGDDGERSALVRAAGGDIPREPMAPAWWLLPPVAYAKHVGRRRRIRAAIFAALNEDEMTTFVTFSNAATGWMLVSTGAAVIASTSLWRNCEHAELGLAGFGLLDLLALAICAMHTVLRIRHAHDLLDEARRAANPPRRAA